MRHLTIVLSVLLMAYGCTNAPRISSLVDPGSRLSKRSPIDLESYESDYGDYDGVYLFRNSTIEHSGAQENLGLLGGSKWSYSRLFETRYVVLNPEADYLTSLTLPWKPDELYVRMIKPTGEVLSFDIDDFREVDDSYGWHDYVLVFPDVRKGCSIEYGYEITYNAATRAPPTSYMFPLQYSIPCKEASFSYIFPDWWEFAVKRTSENTHPAYEVIPNLENRKKTVKVSVTDVAAIVSEPYSPYFKEMANYIQIMITHYKMLGVDYTAQNEWGEIAEKVRSRMLKKERKSDRDLVRMVSNLLKHQETRDDSAMSILVYVRDSIDLVDVHGEGDYKKIMKNRSGGSFEITGLTQRLLKLSGVEASFVLVHTARDGFLDDRYMDIEQFGVPALYFMKNKKPVVSLPYYRWLPVDQTPRELQGQKGLILDEYGGGARTIVCPRDSLIANTRIDNFDIDISGDGSISVVETRTFNGSIANDWRNYMLAINTADHHSALEDELSHLGEVEALDEFEFTNLADPSAPLVLTLKYKADNLLTQASSESIFRVGGFFAPLSEKTERIEVDERKNPIKIYFDQQIVKKIAITIPEGWSLSSVLSDLNIENQFGSRTQTYEIEGNTVIINQIVNLKSGQYLSSDFAEFKEIVSNKEKARVQPMVFSVVE